MRRVLVVQLLLVVVALAPLVARADLVSAQRAYAAQDYSRAFELFRQIAEIGNLTGQENIAAMYVDGQGVKRDNVLGYAWAVIARENGGGAAMQNIIDQLAPHLKEAARIRVAEVTNNFGMAALKERLLPGPPSRFPEHIGDEGCRMTRPVNPDDYYPPTAVREGISGSIVLEVKVMPDGHAHHPQVMYSMPRGLLDDAGRAVAINTGYATPLSDGRPAPCVMRFRVKFASFDPTVKGKMEAALSNAKTLGESGDPTAQVLYGLLMSDWTKAGENKETPLDWFLKSAQAGVPLAQFLVGVMLVKSDPSALEAETAKGIKWLRLAAAAGQTDAKFALANYTLNLEPDSAANPLVYTWLEDAAKVRHRDGTLFLAALLAAGPDAARRDPKRALILMNGDLRISFDLEPTSFEIRAAAHANLGDFKAALSEQKRALREAGRLKWDVTPLQAREAAYEKGQAWNGYLFSEWSGAQGAH